MKRLLILFLIFSPSALVAQQTHQPDEHGQKLRQFYLSLNVENLWIAGHRVNWETGVADGNDDRPNKQKTHCSAFAAAACKKLGVYILNPDNKPHLLANAQYDWLKTPAAAALGWKNIPGENRYGTAQDYANKGYIVIAVFKNPDPDRHGHAALVTPANITDEQLAESGPQLIQAGSHNYNSVPLKTGFKNHLTTWPENDIVFYYFTKPAF
jgi:hypothetical protein